MIKQLSGMQFKHPEILWALILLIIPIIVHLFQLRKFQKTPFTNVKFLKEVAIQTRKSSQLKKWLTLLMRLLALACIIIAFAQPYVSNRDVTTTNTETVIYLDNSFSMQAKGNRGELLVRAVNEIIENVPEDEQITLFTNTETFRNTTVKNIGNNLLQLEYCQDQLSAEDAVLKGKNYFSSENSIKNLILISDFQLKNDNNTIPEDSLVTLHLVQLQPVKKNNISIDSVFIDSRRPENIELQVMLSKTGEDITNLPVSLFNKDELIAKSSVNLEDGNPVTANFSIPANQVINARIVIEDNGLQYDNEFFFNINKPEKINILGINEADDAFLKRIYTSDEFTLTSVSLANLNYSSIPNQNLVVLNELKDIPNSLSTALLSFTKEGGNIVVIPSAEPALTSYNPLLKSLLLPQIKTAIEQEKRITTINYSHPLFSGVFENRIHNFQYPKVNSFLSVNGNASGILQFEDGSSFLTGINNNYFFTAALNDKNSNFKNSPLIVPVLYNIAKNSLKLPDLFFTIGKENSFDINISLSQDEIITVENPESSFIPLQQTYNSLVKIFTDENPSAAGIYNVKAKNEVIQNISFNFSRSESILQYDDLSGRGHISISDSVSEMFDEIKSENNVNELWKWFVIFALVFLLLEMLILKFFK